MIQDNLSRAEVYYNLSENIRKGFEWLRTVDLNIMPDGKYIIDDSNYANVQSYTTKDDAMYEAHRNYVDIQYMIEGEELAGVTDYSNCDVVKNYNKEDDIEFLQSKVAEEFYKIKQGEFFIFFPHDAHKPAIKNKINENVKKVVIKVKV